MPRTFALASAVAVGSIALLAAAQAAPPATAPAKPATPPATAPTKPPAAAPTERTPPEPATRRTPPALPPTYETQVVSAPSPTLSLTFGLRVNAAAGQFLVTGPVRNQNPGVDGQVANFLLKDSLWSPNISMFQMNNMSRNDLAFQRNASGGDTFVTTIERSRGNGSLAVFENANGQWTQKPMIQVPNNLQRPGFGSATSTDGTRLAVSTVDSRFAKEKAKFNENPEVFLFERKASGWEVDAALQVPPFTNSTRYATWFGFSVAIDGNTVACGSPAMLPARVNEATPISGDPMVVVFTKTELGWQPQAEVKGADIGPYQGFGYTVALEGDLMAVCAPAVSVEQLANKVFVFHRSGSKWTLVNELVPAQGLMAGKNFGMRMVVSKGRIFVCDTSAMATDQTSTRGQGMVFVFEARDGRYENTFRLQPQEPCGPGQFGLDVAVNWPWVAVARIKNERLGVDPGGAFLYQLGR